jgi:hypothetical protein
MNLRSRLASLSLFSAFAIVITSACGSSPTAPVVTGRIAITATLGNNAGGPVLGSIVSLRVDVRDAAGAALTNPLIVPVTSSNSSFSAELEVPAGGGREITVLAIGDRPVTGNPEGPDTGIGVIYRGMAAHVDVPANSNSSQTVTLEAFVPELLPLEAAGSGVRVRWTAEPGAQSYSLTRFYDGVGLMTTTVTDTSFVDDTGASRYQIVAVEKSGRRSAPSDFLSGTP